MLCISFCKLLFQISLILLSWFFDYGPLGYFCFYYYEERDSGQIYLSLFPFLSLSVCVFHFLKISSESHDMPLIIISPNSPSSKCWPVI